MKFFKKVFTFFTALLLVFSSYVPFIPLAYAVAPTSMTVDPKTATYGGTVDLTATLQDVTDPQNPVAVPDGKVVQFLLNNNGQSNLCNGPSLPNCPTTVNGVATLSSVSLSGLNVSDSPRIAASFADDGTYAFSTGEANLTITPKEETVTVTDPSPTYDGQPHIADVSTSPDEGISTSITYDIEGTPFENPTDAGNYNVTATIDNPNYSGSNTGTLTISQASTSISDVSGTGTYGGTATVTATLNASPSPSPSTSINFTIGETNVGNSTVDESGVATFGDIDISNSEMGLNLAAGTYADLILATYDGDTNFSQSDTEGTLTINPAPLTVTADSFEISYGQVTPELGAGFNGFVNGEDQSVLGGSLQLTANPTEIQNVGNYTITPSGLTSSNYDISFVDGTLSIVRAYPTVNLDISSSSSTFGTPLSLTATVSGVSVPTGTVSFFVYDNDFDFDILYQEDNVSLVDGIAISSPFLLDTGSDYLADVFYNGDGNFNSNSAEDYSYFEVTPATPVVSLESSLNPSDFGNSVTFTASVTSSAGVPPGTVIFRDGLNVLGQPDLDGNGQAVLTASALDIGTHQVTATYDESSNFSQATSEELSQVVSANLTDDLNLADDLTDISSSNTDFTLESGEHVDLSQVVVGGQIINADQSALLSAGDEIVLSNDDLPNINVSIPDNTTVLAPSSWDGIIQPPSAGSTSGAAPSGFSVGSTVIEVGSPDVVLLFDQPVTVLLSGVTGSVGYKPAGSTTWTQITTACGGTYASPTAPTFPGECFISNGTDTKIYTYHFTTFGSLVAQVTTPSSGSQALSTASAPSCGDSKPGSAPKLLSAVASTNSVNLTWDSASGPVTYYLVNYSRTAGKFEYGNPNVGGAGTTSYTVGGLSGGQTYYFKVRAGNGCAPGDYSNEISATPGGGFIAGPATGFAPGVLGVKTSVLDQENGGQVEGVQSKEPQVVEQTSVQAQASSGNFLTNFFGAIIGFIARLFGR